MHFPRVPITKILQETDMGKAEEDEVPIQRRSRERYKRRWKKTRTKKKKKEYLDRANKIWNHKLAEEDYLVGSTASESDLSLQLQRSCFILKDALRRRRGAEKVAEGTREDGVL
jgi:hypothetical protein